MIQRPEHAPPSEEATAGDPDTGLLAQLEAMLFVATESIPLRRLVEVTGEETAAVREALARLQERYSGESGVHLVEIAGGWRLLTNPECAHAVAALAGKKTKDRLTPAALETLAIIAYKQPISRAEIERVRGVGVGPVVRHLLELGLVKVAGREEGLGRALLYATTREFLDRFGLNDIRDLPASLEV
jgi:segregation and condensation protein B